MLRLNRGQRAVLVERVPELANIGIGALWFGRLLNERKFSWAWALVGLAFLVALIAGTFRLLAEDQ